jgi:hypothetical protein
MRKQCALSFVLSIHATFVQKCVLPCTAHAESRVLIVTSITLSVMDTDTTACHADPVTCCDVTGAHAI